MKNQEQPIRKFLRLLLFSHTSDGQQIKYIINRNLKLPDGARPRVLISTMPKSGTYLLSEIVKEFGFHQTYLHLGRHKLQSYDPALLEHGTLNPRDFDVSLPIEQSNRLIRSGEFAAAHLAPDGVVCECFSDFKVISCIREMRSALRSYARFIVGSGPYRKIKEQEILKRDGFAAWIEFAGPKNVRKAKSIFGWKHKKNALLLRMEDLLLHPESVIRNIAEHLNIEKQDLNINFEAIKNKNTMTKSTKVTADCNWDDVAETAFRNIGGIELNQLLGYE